MKTVEDSLCFHKCNLLVTRYITQSRNSATGKRIGRRMLSSKDRVDMLAVWFPIGVACMRIAIIWVDFECQAKIYLTCQKCGYMKTSIRQLKKTLMTAMC